MCNTNHAAAGIRLKVIGLVMVCGAILTIPADAGERSRSDATWIGPFDGLWSVAANWSGGVVPNGADWNVFIDSDGGTDSSAHVNGTYTVGGLTIDAGDVLRIDNSRDLYHAGGSVLNNGGLYLDSVGSTTYFRLSGSPVTITGDGAIVLGGSAYNRIYANSWTYRLINSGNHTIRGGGSIGINSLLLTNESLVQADADSLLTLDLAGDAANTNYNTGTLEATGGGTLVIAGTPLDNTGGIIQALDGSVVQLSSGTHIIGGTVTSQGSGIMQVLSSSAYFEDLLHEGNTSVDNSDTLYVLGTVTNDGLISIDSLGSATALRLGGAEVTLTGDGEVVLNDHIFSRIYATDWHYRLTNTGNHTIRGGGNFGVNTMLLTNESLVQADMATELTLDLAGDADNWNYNTGTMQATNGGMLRLAGMPLDNTGGVIQALEGSVVRLNGATHVLGGTLTTQGSGYMEVLGGNACFENLLHEGNTRIDNSDDLHVVGTVTNTGVIEVNSVGSAANLWVDGPGATLTGAGEVVLNGHAFSRIYASDWHHRLTNTGGQTIRGGGNVGVNNMLLTNESLVQADHAGTSLRIDLAGDADNWNFNTGTMQATDGGTLIIASTTIDNTGGLIQAMDGSDVQLQTAYILGGTMSTQDSGVMVVDLGTTYFEDLVHEGYCRIDNSDDLRLIGTVTNNGVITIESVGSASQLWVGEANVTLDGTGEVVLNGHIYSRINAGDWTHVLTNGTDHTIRGGGNIGVNNMGLVNQGAIVADSTGTLTVDVSEAGLVNEGLIHVTGDGYLDMNAGPLDHYGTVLIDETRTLHRDGDFTQTGGLTTVEGTLEVAGGVVDLQGGVVEGTGTVAANVSTVEGTVAPGLSAGTLTIDGDYLPDACGELLIELGGYLPGDEHDVLAVTGTASLDGIITVELINDFIPQIGDTFEILTAASVQGYFGQSCPNFPDLPEGHLFVSHAADSVSLVVLAEGPVYGDVNWDNVVDIDDLFGVLANWGPCDCDCCPGDIDGNQQVDIDDVFAVLANWT